MNCQEFRSNIDGLARGALLDARTRDAAVEHEASCSLCAALLADERALTDGLRALAAKMSGAETPARAEAALLSAFRSRAATTCMQASEILAAPSNLNASSNVVSLSERADEKHWSWVKTVAVAALAAAAVALFMLVPPYLSSPVPSNQSASKNQGSPVKAQDKAVNSSAPSETAQSSNESSVQSSGGPASTALKNDEDEPSPVSTPRRNPVRGAMTVGYNPSHVGAPNRGATNESADIREITTEFIPLVQDAGFTQSEGTHLVRVELPRSALSSFGIPVNAEQTGGRVKADVLVGEDGTARAIRFVQERAAVSGR